ncbi:MAG: hypothetical protein ACOZAM_27185 [Pseudomonadota bacterium]
MKEHSQNSGSLVPRIARRRRSHIGKLWGLIGAVVLCANAEYVLGDVLGLNLEEDFRLILGTALVGGMVLGGLAAAFLMRPEIGAEDVAGRAHPSRGRDS